MTRPSDRFVAAGTDALARLLVDQGLEHPLGEVRLQQPALTTTAVEATAYPLAFMDELEAAGEAFLVSSCIHDRATVLIRPSPVPETAGVYGWWFRRPPVELDTSNCFRRDGLTLLYTGISPRKPPTNGRAPSRQNLRTRINTHFTGNAEGSTLRKTLGCLLSAELGIELRRVGSGKRMTFLAGERDLSCWMAENALVSWIVHPRPWELEDHLIATLDVPLNLQGNARNRFHADLSARRADAVARARYLPIVANPRVGGR